MSLSALPLRLWAPPHLERQLNNLGSSFRNHVLDINLQQHNKTVTIVLDDYGILGIVVDSNDQILNKYVKFSGNNKVLSNNLTQSIVNEHFLLTASETSEISFILVRANSNSSIFVPIGSGQINFNESIALNHLEERKKKTLHSPVAKKIVNGIYEYYKTQILEPSVRGFLFILEKQFPRNDLYLFELLQNAVDDGASFVSFKCIRNLNGGTVRVTHNGRRFTPLDVIGLSSVGLSTKTSNRTVGFMGIGFKAVYKRFHRVHISDGTFSFQFENPQSKNNNNNNNSSSSSSSSSSGSDSNTGRKGKSNHGWVMLPHWIENKHVKRDIADRALWCQFDLSRCVGGISAAEKDLQYIPFTCPPLLGRTALKNSNDTNVNTWTLDWNGKQFQVTNSTMANNIDNGGKQAVSYSDTSEKYIVHELNNNGGKIKTSEWIFIKTKFKPGNSAINAFATHTKKQYGSNGEEVCIFFKLSSKSGAPLRPKYNSNSSKKSVSKKYNNSSKNSVNNTRNYINGGGLLHSVLPTKIKLPFGFHLQASWLLSVDRQDIQDSFENDWNRELIQQIPDLLLYYLDWIKQNVETNDPRVLLQTYEMFPCDNIERSSKNQPCILKLIGVPTNLNLIEKALLTTKLLPVRKNTDDNGEDKKHKLTIDSYEFVEGSNCILLPESFIKNLNVNFLKSWLVFHPVDTVALGQSFSSCALFDKIRVLTPEIFESRAQSLSMLFVKYGVSHFIDLYVAFGEAIATVNGGDGGGGIKNNSSNAKNMVMDDDIDKNESNSSSASNIGSFLENIEQWYIFPSIGNNVVSCNDLRFPDDEYHKLSIEQQQILQKYITRPKDYVEKLEKYNQDFRRYNKEQEERNRRNNNNNRRNYYNKKGKRRGGYNPNNRNNRAQIGTKPKKPREPTMVHQELWTEMNKIVSDSVSSSSTNFHVKKYMSIFLNVITENSKSEVQTIDLIDSLFEHIASSRDMTIDASLAKTLIEFTIFKYKRNSTIKYVLCNIDTTKETYKLVHGHKAFLSPIYGTKSSKDLKILWDNIKDIPSRSSTIAINFVSDVYFTYSSSVDWLLLFKHIHVNDGLQLIPIKQSYSKRQLMETTRAAKEKIEIRKSKKEVTLPYGLGNLSNKTGRVDIDIDFADIFIWFLEQTSTQLVINRKRKKVSADSKDSKLNNSSSSTNKDEYGLGQLLVAANAFASLLGYLELDLDIFEFEGFLNENRKQIRIRRELRPCVDGILDTGTDGSVPIPLIVNTKSIPTRKRIFYLPPKKPGVSILDSGDNAKWIDRLIHNSWVPVKEENQKITFVSPPAAQFVKPREKLISHLKEIDLPFNILHSLLKSKLYEIVEFQSKNPPSPMESFLTFAKRVEAVGSTTLSVEEITSIWLNLFKEDDTHILSAQDKLLIKIKSKKTALLPYLYSAPSVEEKKDNSELVLLSTLRCCSGRKNSLGQNVGGTEKQIELRNALIESKWLVDLSETPLSSIAHKISPILDLKCWTTSDQCESYLNWMFETMPLPDKVPGISIGYSMALEKLLYNDNNARLRKPPTKIFRNLKVCLYSKKERNYKWVDFEEIKSKAVRVYVNNNWKVELLLKDVLKEKKIMKVVLPSIDNKFINNMNNNNNSSKLSIDSAWSIIRVLDLPCLNDKKYFSVGIKSEGQTMELPNELYHLKKVVDIYMNNQEQQLLGNQSSSAIGMKIPLKFIRCENLFRIYRIYNDLPIRKPCWCAWLGSTAIKVQGDAEDYVAELTEELLRRLPRKLVPPTPKLLNLLYYVNDKHKFNKFARRYFNYVDPNDVMGKEEESTGGDKKRKRDDEVLDNETKDEEQQSKKIRADGGGNSIPVWIQDKMAGVPIGVKPEEIPSSSVGRGRGVNNKPAWMLSDGSSDAATTVSGITTKGTTSIDSNDNTNNSNSLTNVDTTINDIGVMPHGVSTSNVIGRGRGVSNKPAWMVDGGIVLGKVPSPEEEIQNDIKNVSNNNGSNNDKMDIEEDDGQKTSTETTAREIAMFLNSVECEQSALPTSLNQKEEEFSPPTSTSSVGRGRGRGLTVPAWMNGNNMDVQKSEMMTTTTTTIVTGGQIIGREASPAVALLPALALLQDGKMHRVHISNESIDYDIKLIVEKSIVSIGNGMSVAVLLQDKKKN